MKIIKLETREQLNIYMNPVRQQLLRELGNSGMPMTPKALSIKLNISASSVQHHIKKLLSIGVLEIHHQEMINGITATYYSHAKVRVQIWPNNQFANERQALMLQSVNNVVSDIICKLNQADKVEFKGDKLRGLGDILTGVLYLSENDQNELFSYIDNFINTHEQCFENTNVWEYAFILSKVEK